MIEAKHNIEFLENVSVAAPSGGAAAALGYKFRVDGKIKVTVWASLFEGGLSQEQVKDLARKQIEAVLGSGLELKDDAELKFKS
jgi:hypothetical protein